MLTNIQHIDWSKVAEADMDLIRQIADRVVKLSREHDMDYEKLEVVMDLTATHIKCPLQLTAMLTVDNVTLAHDAFGIRRHLNRQNGELMDCFLPRCAR